MGKAVNSLRKHDIVGELAKSLVAKWKKLVPQSADRYVQLMKFYSVFLLEPFQAGTCGFSELKAKPRFNQCKTEPHPYTYSDTNYPSLKKTVPLFCL